MPMFYLAYQIRTSNCSGLSTIFKISAVLAEKVERKVDVNQDESLTDLQTLIKYSFLLNFLHEYRRLMRLDVLGQRFLVRLLMFL